MSYPPPRLKDSTQADLYSCITHIEWQHLYKTYIDKNLIIPRDDVYRDKLNKNILKKKILRRIANLVVIFCIWKMSKQQRQKTRAKILATLHTLFR